MNRLFILFKADLADSIKNDIEAGRLDVAAHKIKSDYVKDIILWKNPLHYNKSLLHVIAQNKGADNILDTLVQLVEPSEVDAWVKNKDIYGETCLHVAAIWGNSAFLEKLLNGREIKVI